MAPRSPGLAPACRSRRPHPEERSVRTASLSKEALTKMQRAPLSAKPCQIIPSRYCDVRRTCCPKISAGGGGGPTTVDAADLVAGGRLGQVVYVHAAVRDVEHEIVVLDEEVMMVGGVGVEIGLRPVDRDLAQQARLGELVGGRCRPSPATRARDRASLPRAGSRPRCAGCPCEKNLGERHALARRPQARMAQHRPDLRPRARMGRFDVCVFHDLFRSPRGSRSRVSGQGVIAPKPFWPILQSVRNEKVVASNRSKLMGKRAGCGSRRHRRYCGEARA